MKARNVRKTVDTILDGERPVPSIEEMRRRIDRVWNRVRSEIHATTDDSGSISVSIRPAWKTTTTPQPWRRRRVVYVLALLITAGVGLIAAQRAGVLSALFTVQRARNLVVAPSAKPPSVSLLQTPPQPVVPVAQAEATPITPVPEISTIAPVSGTTPRQPVTTIAAQVAAAQSTDAGARRLQFAAASVRPGRPAREQPLTPVRCKGVDGEVETGFGPMNATDPGSPPQGRCAGNNVPLIGLLITAYGITDGDRIIGLPDLDAQATYQIQSVAEDPSRTTKADLQQMLQNLLTDRFHANVRRETRERDGFVLTVAKSGIKFSVALGDSEQPSMRSPQGTRLAYPAATGQTGGSLSIMVKGRYRMNIFVPFVQELLGDMPVADKTNLSGLYDINLTFDLIQSVSAGVGGRGQRGQRRGGLETSPPLPKALEDQLGLRLEPGKIPVEFLVVDHLEKPSEN